MQSLLRRIVLALVLALTGHGALASCTLSTSNLSSANNYDPFSTAFNDSGGIFSISCTRTNKQSKFTSVFYAYADNGVNYSGTTRRLANGSSTLDYALYRDYTGCSQPWGATNATAYSFPNSATQGSSTTTSPNPLTSGTSYCFRITGGTNTAIPGTYTDIVQMSVVDANGVVVGSTSVTLTTTVLAACKVLSAPLPVTVTYTSFQPTAAVGNSTFQIRCTNTTSYSVGFDAPVAGTNDTILGLNYALASSLSSGIGTGSSQTYGLTVTLPSNQAGICAAGGGSYCTGTVTRAVQISY